MKSKRNARGYPTYALHQVQIAFVNALSAPKWITEKLTLNPKYKYEHKVGRAARNAKCPQRTNKFLSKPKIRNIYRKLDDGCRFRVRKAALKSKPTAWNTFSAIPKMRTTLANKKKFAKVLKGRHKKVLNRNYCMAKNMFRQQHPPEEGKIHGIMSGAPIHMKCFDEVIKLAKKPAAVCKIPQRERKNFMLRMIRLGQPKPRPKPPRPPRGPKKPMKQLQKRIAKLMVPKFGPRKHKSDPFAVKQGAMNYQITSRTADLAHHKEIPPPPPVYDFRGREILPPRVWDIASRQKVIASERTCDLATPKRVKKKAAVDDKADPYAVSKAALTAVATDRIIDLAKPIMRD